MKKKPAFLHQSTGFSLLELTVALVIGFGITSGVLLLAFRQIQAQQQGRQLSDLQDSGQYALQSLVYDLSMAGFMGHLLNNAVVDVSQASPPNLDCGAGVPNNQTKLSNIWVYQANQPIEFLNNSPTQNGKFSCLPSVQKNSDIIAIRRVKAKRTDIINSGTSMNNLMVGLNYFLTSRNQGYLFTAKKTLHDSPFNEESDLWQYITQIYAVMPHSAPDKMDNIPTLCRLEFYQNNQNDIWQNNVDNCLSLGIETLQIQWGLDADQDGQIERYVYAPTADELLNVKIAHISILARALQQDTTYKNKLSYQLADEPVYTPNNDHYRRKIYRSSVLIPNKPPQFVPDGG